MIVTRQAPYLEVPPGFLLACECIRDPDELVHRHLRESVVVDDCPTAGLLASYYVAARGLRLVISIQTVTEIDLGVWPEGRQDLGCGW